MILKLDKIRAFNHFQHNIIDGFYARDLIHLSNNLMGLHSARLPTPFVTIHSRFESIQTIDLYNKIFVDNHLIKLRCMRTTLHTASLDLAPILHKSTLYFRISDINRYYKTNNIKISYIESTKNKISSYLKDQNASPNDILYNLSIELGSNYNKETCKIILKDLWENGDICYINNNTNWQKEDRNFGLTSRIYPNLNLNLYDEFDAQKLLIKNYINAFGPVSFGDIYRRSGLRKTIISNVLVDIFDDLSIVNIEGFDGKCYMTNNKLFEFNDFDHLGLEWLELLAYEDSSLKGYHETRFRYIDNENYNNLFNQIGEVRASIIYNGKAIGIWSRNKKYSKIDYSLFYDFDNNMINKIKHKIHKMENYLKVGI